MGLSRVYTWVLARVMETWLKGRLLGHTWQKPCWGRYIKCGNHEPTQLGKSPTSTFLQGTSIAAPRRCCILVLVRVGDGLVRYINRYNQEVSGCGRCFLEIFFGAEFHGGCY
jgi:hypothetical protein